MPPGWRPPFSSRVDQFAFFPLFLLHQDGQADVVGVLVDDVLELPGVGVFERVVAQVQDHAGAARGAVDGLDLEVAGAAADPAHALAGFMPARRDSTVILSATMKPE
jgi:hypothetical protein